MSRISSLHTASHRHPIDVVRPSEKISDFFASHVFTLEKMRSYLNQDVYEKVAHSIDNGLKIDRELADHVAAAMKSWAINMGATHHTHWFQPLTGATAEKHDTFFMKTETFKGIENFNANQLVQGEPDGSSFPSGGLRDTHEARGYTAWDPTSPAFIMEIGDYGKTLCVPTVFISYTGHSMDYKGPLLKSLEYLEKAAVPVCHLFDKNVTKVIPTLGWEQEYFLVDSALFLERPDLQLCGRTLFGSAPAKGQQLSDHYFGSIPERVYAFMLDLETEALQLGIPLSTRHNEVAPGQYEFAPIYNDLNLAVDQNQLLMDLMERVAKRHLLRVLLHEKPFAGLNGSGKHNNWSMRTDTGINLLKPGKTPKTNLMFLTFFVCTIKAVNEYDNLLRASIASAANDHRLGGHEAPPAIISVFIGKTLTQVLDEVAEKVKKGSMDEYDSQDLKLNIHNLIPDVLIDNTDRNRTSPFAFTGNKFEIRAVGSSANCGWPMTVMNTIVGKILNQFKTDVDDLVTKGDKKDSAILRVIKNYISDSKRICFEGDNYSDEWKAEALSRGLKNVTSSAYAFDFYDDVEVESLFEESGVLSIAELKARVEVWNTIFYQKTEIEAKLMNELIATYIIPAGIKYLNELLENIRGLENISESKIAPTAQRYIVAEVANRINVLNEKRGQMKDAIAEYRIIEHAGTKAKAFADHIKPLLAEMRKEADMLEQIIADAIWPFPKYRELLFTR